MLKNKVLISAHGYAGDADQIKMLLPLMEHHGYPLIIVSPTDSPILRMGGHICRQAGLREYYGQKSWDRQHAQLKMLLEYDFQWYFMNDSDSICLSPQFPNYLFEDENMVYSNEVDDFRKPGETSHGITWPLDYHQGYKNVAMQPSYWVSRKALEKIVVASEGMIACPTTPFIDWWWVPACKKAGVNHQTFRNGQGASCETKTPNGIKVMSNCVNSGAIFVHAIKTKKAKDIVVKLYKQRNKK